MRIRCVSPRCPISTDTSGLAIHWRAEHSMIAELRQVEKKLLAFAVAIRGPWDQESAHSPAHSTDSSVLPQLTRWSAAEPAWPQIERRFSSGCAPEICLVIVIRRAPKHECASPTFVQVSEKSLGR